MSTHEHTIVVDRPVRVVYDQWTQFETYPEFMDNVEDVEQLNDTLTHWKVRVGGVEREYDATITDQRPDEVIEWHTVEGPDQGGMVTFTPVEDDRTRVTLRMLFEPEGLTESVGDAVGVVSASVERSLRNFKDFIEDEGSPTGSWRGTVEGGATTAMDDITGPTSAGSPAPDPLGPSPTSAEPWNPVEGMEPPGDQRLS